MKLKHCSVCSAPIYPGRGLVFVPSNPPVQVWCSAACKSKHLHNVKREDVPWTKASRKRRGKDGIKGLQKNLSAVDLVSAAMTCQSWHNTIGTGMRSVELNCSDIGENCGETPELLHEVQNMKRALASMKTVMPMVQEFTLTGSTNSILDYSYGSELLRELAWCRQLQALHVNIEIESSRQEEIMMAASNLSGLTALTLKAPCGWCSLSPPFFFEMVQPLGRLVELHIHEAYKILFDLQEEALPLALPPRLRRVTLPLNFLAEAVRVPNQIACVEELEVKAFCLQAFGSDEGLVQHVQALAGEGRSLRRLKLQFGSHRDWPNHDHWHAVLFRALADHMSHLQEIELVMDEAEYRKMSYFTAENSVWEALAAVKNCAVLSIRCCDGESNNVRALKRLPHLRDFKLNTTWPNVKMNMSRQTIDTLALWWTTLSTLHLTLKPDDLLDPCALDGLHAMAALTDFTIEVMDWGKVVAAADSAEFVTTQQGVSVCFACLPTSLLRLQLSGVRLVLWRNPPVAPPPAKAPMAKSKEQLWSPVWSPITPWTPKHSGGCAEWERQPAVLAALDVLVMSDVEVSSEDFAAVMALVPGMRTLSVSECGPLGMSGAVALAVPPKLRSLSFRVQGVHVVHEGWHGIESVVQMIVLLLDEAGAEAGRRQEDPGCEDCQTEPKVQDSATMVVGSGVGAAIPVRYGDDKLRGWDDEWPKSCCDSFSSSTFAKAGGGGGRDQANSTGLAGSGSKGLAAQVLLCGKSLAAPCLGLLLNFVLAVLPRAWDCLACWLRIGGARTDVSSVHG